MDSILLSQFFYYKKNKNRIYNKGNEFVNENTNLLHHNCDLNSTQTLNSTFYDSEEYARLSSSSLVEHYKKKNVTFNLGKNVTKTFFILFGLNVAYHNSSSIYNNSNTSSKVFSNDVPLTAQNSFSFVDDFSLGDIFGYTSIVLFILARFPQIFQNYKNKSVEGLEILMFYFALLGNFTFSVSILLESIEYEYIKRNLPWLLGAVTAREAKADDVVAGLC
ncbi:hypothetical protein HDU92_001445 [Lobulomyces angularis]|nr:hypothetical protein HDU92_001445 [Lobulomyces angularis]